MPTRRLFALRMMAPQITARLEQENLRKNGGTCLEETHYFPLYAAVAAWSSSLTSCVGSK